MIAEMAMMLPSKETQPGAGPADTGTPPAAGEDRAPERTTTPASRVLVVGGGPFQIDIIRVAKSLGHTVIVVDRNPAAPGMLLADHALPVDICDAEAVLAVARRYAVQCAITAASDAAVQALTAVVEALGLEGHPAQAVHICRDKLTTYEHVRAAGLAVPETRLVFDTDEAARHADEVGGYPLVIKPRAGAGGRGVTIVATPDQLPAAVARALGYSSPGQGVLLQQYVGGISVGVEAFLWRGAVAAAFVINDQHRPGFVSPIGHSLPSQLDEATRARVIAAAAGFARTTGLRSGPANFDLRLLDGVPVLLEINPRLGGSSITELVRTCYGADLSAATVAAALGQPPQPHLAPRWERPVASRLFAVTGEGALRVDGDPGAAWTGQAEVLCLDLLGRNEDDSLPRVDQWSLVGRCLVAGAEAQQAEALAARVAGAVESACHFAGKTP